MKVRTGVRAPGLESGAAIRVGVIPIVEESLPKDPAARVAFVRDLLEGFEIVDDDGKPTGERTAPLITQAMALVLLERP